MDAQPSLNSCQRIPPSRRLTRRSSSVKIIGDREVLSTGYTPIHYPPENANPKEMLTIYIYTHTNPSLLIPLMSSYQHPNSPQHQQRQIPQPREDTTIKRPAQHHPGDGADGAAGLVGRARRAQRQRVDVSDADIGAVEAVGLVDLGDARVSGFDESYVNTLGV